MKSHWKRFNYISGGLGGFACLNLFLDVINKKLFNSRIPGDMVSNLFWLSMGLYLGFLWCQREYGRGLKKQQEDQKNISEYVRRRETQN
jgi:hypothetical protein